MRLPTATLACSLAGLPFIIPHVVEDFSAGLAQRVGLSTAAAAFLLGGWLALQSLGLALIARDRRAGWIVTFGVSLVWTMGAVIDHGPDVVAGPFRSGPLSVLWVVGLVVTQAVTAVLAWQGWRRIRVT
jgi:hypothetical protein